MREVFKRVFGYFGRSKDKKRGPTVLGMETDNHKFVPDAEEIRKAVREAKEAYRKKEE